MTVIRCHACTALAARSAQFTDGMKQEQARGLSFHIQHEGSQALEEVRHG